MSETTFRVTANLVDVLGQRIFPAELSVVAGRIASIRPTSTTPKTFLAPGFVDAHVHVESSLLVPSEFARAAVVHGTVATVSDPHEIGNVLGVEGVHFMLANAQQTPLKISFGAPSCVPATHFETAGGCIGAEEVAELLDDPRIGFLSEMMNYPGVLQRDPNVMKKIELATRLGKKIDGHAPQVRGEDARAYFSTGISTDHECVTYEEAVEKIGLGVNILIRAGSAARNFDALCRLVDEHCHLCMFCTDDLHPDELIAGHINALVRRAVSSGLDVMKVLRCACVNPVQHYGLNVGLLRVGAPADFVELADLQDFEVLRTFVDGRLVAKAGQTTLDSIDVEPVNRFERAQRSVGDFRIERRSYRIRVVKAIDGELITRQFVTSPSVDHDAAVADPSRDLLKVTVVNRYQAVPPAVAFIKGFGLHQGAIASSVAHDSHNVVAVGTNDELLAAAVNRVIAAGGGLSAVGHEIDELLPLPVAGLMSSEPYEKIAAAYSKLDRTAKDMGSTLRAPFMTLSFMALLVIPELKISDRGLFDCSRGSLVPLFI